MGRNQALKMKGLTLFFTLLLSASGFSQHNLLGKSQEYIANMYRYDPEFIVKIDTISPLKAIIKCKTSKTYPYYTYELDLLEDRCISYGFVSKNQEILRTHIELLSFLGKIIERDSAFVNIVYEIETVNKKIFYSVKQPFAKSQIRTRRDIYYILITEEKKKTEEDED